MIGYVSKLMPGLPKIIFNQNVSYTFGLNKRVMVFHQTPETFFSCMIIQMLLLYGVSPSMTIPLWSTVSHFLALRSSVLLILLRHLSLNLVILSVSDFICLVKIFCTPVVLGH